jgi:hypothetical protein
LEDDNSLDEALRLIDQLWAARLIDHISRPVDKKIKEEHIGNFKNMLVNLHERLKRVMNEAAQKNQGGKTQPKIGSGVLKPREWSKYIRGI